jgi:hypothetical protein
MGPRIAAVATSVPLQYTLRPSTCAPASVALRNFGELTGRVEDQENAHINDVVKRCRKGWVQWLVVQRDLLIILKIERFTGMRMLENSYFQQI